MLESEPHQTTRLHATLCHTHPSVALGSRTMTELSTLTQNEPNVDVPPLHLHGNVHTWQRPRALAGDPNRVYLVRPRAVPGTPSRALHAGGVGLTRFDRGEKLTFGWPRCAAWAVPRLLPKASFPCRTGVAQSPGRPPPALLRMLPLPAFLSLSPGTTGLAARWP